MQQGFDELGLSRRRVIGSAPESLAATARALVAIEARAASNQVALMVIGRPPDKIGDSLERSVGGGTQRSRSLLSPPQLNQVERRLRGLWPPGPNALGHSSGIIL